MIIKAGLDLIKHYEGLHDGDLKTIGLQPKMCPVGIWTVGYGRALVDKQSGRFLSGMKDKEKAYAMFPTITEKQAEEMLAEDLTRFEAIVNTHTKKLNAHEFAACVSLCYNIGAGNFASSSVVKFIRNDKKQDAADAFLLWNKGTIDGVRVTLPGLIARRKSERELFLTGIFKPFK